MAFPNLFRRESTDDHNPLDQVNILKLRQELRLVQNACARKARTIRSLREKVDNIRREYAAAYRVENTSTEQLGEIVRAIEVIGGEVLWRDDGGFAGIKLPTGNAPTKTKKKKNGEAYRSKEYNRHYAKGYSAGRKKGHEDMALTVGGTPNATNGTMLEGMHDTGGGLYAEDSTLTNRQ